MLGKFIRAFQKDEVVGIEAETDAESLERGIFALDGYASAKGLEETQEKDFYCGICGWSPISTFPHDH